MKKGDIDIILQTLWFRMRAIIYDKSILARLIQINVLLFCIINISGVISYFTEWDYHFLLQYGMFPLTYYLSLPAAWSLFTQQYWGLFTYMFVHEAFFHLLFNMMVLYMAGNIFNHLLGIKRLLSTYIIGGLFGGMLYMLAFNLLPPFSHNVDISFAIGASASVLAILVAAATFYPHYSVKIPFFNHIPLLYIALFFVLIDIVSIPFDNPGGHISHLGGAFYGWLYVRLWRRGIDINHKLSSLVSSISHAAKGFIYQRKTTDTIKVKHHHKPNKKNKTNEETAAIARIVDKVKSSGYASLSEAEKKRLFE